MVTQKSTRTIAGPRAGAGVDTQVVTPEIEGVTAPHAIWRKRNVLVLATLLRIAFFCWGLYQDAHMVPKFTDVDYMVFTDAARFVNQGLSPYNRETYRYTPLLALILVPTTHWFSFGKFLFVAGDLVAGALAIDMLVMRKFTAKQASMYSSVWLLNPMVAAISTRGSSEGLLGAIVMLTVWLVMRKRYVRAGLAAGLAIHFKIYPFIYIPTIGLALGPPLSWDLRSLWSRARFLFAMGTVVSFSLLTGLMYYIYGHEYIYESWLYHLVRLDHRHNFSVYSTSLYYSLAHPSKSFQLESWAFAPQLILSAVVLPLAFARTDLLKTMFIQTFLFVTFNKVCTSQYFIWYIVLLPFYMPSLVTASKSKYVFTAFWVAGQAIWIAYAFQLEFLGQSRFFPELFSATVLFFVVNVWGICLMIDWM